MEFLKLLILLSLIAVGISEAQTEKSKIEEETEKSKIREEITQEIKTEEESVEQGQQTTTTNTTTKEEQQTEKQQQDQQDLIFQPQGIKQQKTKPKKTKINIYILTAGDRHLLHPAVRLASKNLFRRQIARHYDVTVHYMNMSCDIDEFATVANKLVGISRDSGDFPSLILGPICPTPILELGELAESMNIVMVTTGWRAGWMSHNYNVVKIAPPYLDTSHYVRKFTEHYVTWQRTVVFFEEHDDDYDVENSCYFFSQSVVAAYRENAVFADVTDWTPENMRQNLEPYRHSKNMFIVCASPTKLHQLVTSSYEAEMNDCSKYRWVAVDLQDENNFRKGIWKHGDTTWTDDNKSAYGNLLFFTLRDSPKVRRSSVPRRLMKIYRRKFPEITEIDENIQGIQESLVLYSHGLKKILNSGDSPTDGKNMRKMMSNITMEGFYREIKMDSYGERTESYDIFALSDATTGKFETAAEASKVAESSCTKQKYQPTKTQFNQIIANAFKTAGIENPNSYYAPDNSISDRLANIREVGKKIDAVENDGKLDIIAALSAIIACLLFIFLPLCLRHRKMKRKRKLEMTRNGGFDEHKEKRKVGEGRRGRPEETSTTTRMSYLDEEISSASSSSSSASSVSKDSFKNLVHW